MAKTFAQIWGESLWDKVPSPSMRRINTRYHEQGVYRWTNKRVFGLARKFNLTLGELCYTAAYIHPCAVKKAITEDRWPGPVALHFTLWEQFYFQWFNGETARPLVFLDPQPLESEDPYECGL